MNDNNYPPKSSKDTASGSSGKNNGLYVFFIALLSVITIIALSITLFTLLNRDKDPDGILPPDYASLQADSSAESLDDTVNSMNAPQGGGAVSLTYSTDVNVYLSANQATIFIKNPSKSTQSALVQLVIRDTLIAQSGLIPAGNQLKVLTLEEGIFKQLEAGGYDGKFIITYYDSKTFERSMVNMEVPVKVTVNP